MSSRNRSPFLWWFAAAVLGLFAVLMASHLAVLWYAVLRCDAHASIRLAHIVTARPGEDIPDQIRPAAVCGQLGNLFGQTAKIYIGAILGLLSGAGFSAGAAYAVSSSEEDEP